MASSFDFKDGLIAHVSGLMFEIDPDLGITTHDPSFESWQSEQLRQNVTLESLLARVQELLDEATLWYERQSS